VSAVKLNRKRIGSHWVQYVGNIANTVDELLLKDEFQMAF